MSLVFYNTLGRQKQPFSPLDPEHIKMYVCGPTVYARAHIGNARPVVVFDVLFRLLSKLYPQVTYVRNVTDIDDKIIKAAKHSDEPIQTITEKFLKFYEEDMGALGALPPTIQPKATEHVTEMQTMIQSLIDQGYAYESEGHVLFSVAKDLSYGVLSRLKIEDRIMGARVEVAPYKRDPQDFVLWKPSPPSMPGWDSPWGRGRPGWHIECSAMAGKYLGVTFDIHGGGLDLIFPHHENEIAQSRCAHQNAPLAQVWMHNGHLTMKGDKMSKSDGNILVVNDLLQEYPGEVIRLALLSTQYRQPLEWGDDTLPQAKNVLDRLYRALEEFTEDVSDEHIPEDFLEILGDDLNLPAAISFLHDLASSIYKASESTHDSQRKLKTCGLILGILQKDPEDWFKWQRPGKVTLSDKEIECLLQERQEARSRKDFARADEIRKTLDQEGLILEDSPEGTKWRRS
jgi:cysteinyl-tRNA synthetase